MDRSDFDRMNKSELVFHAQVQNTEVHRGMSREQLIAIIFGEEVELPQRRINKLRLKTMGYILKNWTQVRPVLSCPAKSMKPTACFSCTDIQAAECAMKNPAIQQFEPTEEEA